MRSWKIGTAFGIGIYLHWSFIIVPLWLLLGTGAGVGAAVFYLGLTCAMFGCVVLHELGHALSARYFGIRTQDITLYPIGGVARLESTGEKPREEIWIALAGPAVNLAIVLGMAALLNLGLMVAPGFNASLEWQFLSLLMMLNLAMAVFNLIPAFPMDGGRVLRAALSLPLGRLQATRIAAWVATVIAIVGGVVGVFYLNSPMLPIIALFIYMGAQQELQAVEMRERQRQADPEPNSEPFTANSWQGFGMKPSVTVYVWDSAAGLWVKQRNVT